MATPTSEFGLVGRGLPQPLADGLEGEVRLSRYRDAMVANLMATKHMLADEGSYFVSTNPTPGTGLAGEPGTITSAEFAALNRADYDRYGKLIRDAAIKLE